MLVGRHHRVRVDELFQHRRRIMFRRVDDRAGRGVPPSRIEPSALAVIDRMRAVGIADPITGQHAVGDLRAHAPPPYAARPSRLMTTSAPGPVASATSSGALLSSMGCARPRKSRTRSEEHTSELQSLMRNSYAVFCW